MTEVTRVPLQPIAKGSLTKLWLGVAIAVLVAFGIAWASMPQGLSVDTIRAGEGPSPTEEDVVFVNYTGKLADGTVFDQSQAMPLPIEGIFPDGTPLPLGDMIPGFRDALLKTQKGGQYEIFIPADQAYGEDVPEGGPIPPNSDLYFDIQVIEFMSREEFQSRVSTFQQMMMQQQMETQGEGEGAGEIAPPAE
ncbi:MAG: FKBP-type peptidyl-prolyl cis-trans isomerase [Alteraurantiacibacter sp.]